MTVALMYHALYRGNDTSAIDSDDLPYAVAEADFRAQLDLIAERSSGLLGRAGDELPDVILTFDDGHASNHELALPILAARGLSAYFFITTDFIDRRKGFCSASQVAELAAGGMAIGSHGVSHAFFDDLTGTDLDREFLYSRERLQEMSGTNVESLSFPGGRFVQHSVLRAASAGYTQLFGSGFGTIRAADLTELKVLDRVAIRNGTSLADFSRIIDVDARYYTAQRSKQQLKWLARRVLGNRLYHGLYQSFSSG